VFFFLLKKTALLMPFKLVSITPFLYLAYMRLSKIKLAGFKSFVDPTTLYFPSDLTGVVGPNGCGKSNVIDAVRWVMGESSAKNLRGESMADVIFNGSNARKPVAQASVELEFDNSDGAIGGQYAGYNEIALRRQVSRDGTSNYYLNGTKCRRRDITDIFLGTGLGPRSYSIIEQGMISRLIEAKPEDLRVFLEEAAGISKYKERRRETETRIRHTRENLSRLNDLREEIDKQLEKLQRQSKAAAKFKELREQERRIKAELLTLRYQALHEESAGYRDKLKEKENALEAIVAELRAIEADLEKGRVQQSEASDKFNKVQGRFYELGAEVARIEQAIQHGKETRLNQQDELQKAEQARNEIQAHIKVDSGRLEQLAVDLTENEPALSAANKLSAESQEKREKAETAMSEWQVAWDSFNQRSNEVSQTAQVERTRADHIEKQQNQLQQRLEKTEQEQKRNDASKLENEIQALQKTSEERQHKAQAMQQELDQLRQRIETLREQTRTQQRELHEAQSLQQDMRGRLSSLQALQQAALGEQDSQVAEWLSQQKLSDAPRLAKQLDVDAGWERAVETVLGLNLEAICLDGINDIASAVAELEQGSLTLIDTSVRSQSMDSSKAEPLASKVRAEIPIEDLFAGIYTADSLNQAMQLRSGLAVHESVVTTDGVWIGSNWLRVIRSQDEKSGVLEREKLLTGLDAQLTTSLAAVALLEGTSETVRKELLQSEAQREELQVEANLAHRQYSDAKAQLEARTNRLEQVNSRTATLHQEASDIRTQQQELEEQLKTTKTVLHDSLTLLETVDNDREMLTGQRDQLREALDKIRSQAQLDRDKSHELALKNRAYITDQETTGQNLERMKGQQSHLDQRRDSLTQSLTDSESPLKKQEEELAGQLEKRLKVEGELADERRKVEAIDHHLREQEQARHKTEDQTQQFREGLTQGQLHWQEIKVRAETLLEQVAESGFELTVLAEEMNPEATVDAWTEEAERLEKRIHRLGPINLAAIEEFEVESERKVYLDAQHTDVTSALETLENAIRKIDHETRSRFKETFDKVNSGIQETFPRLFGGGHASLEMTGDDLLDTGITIMARPPGKRNSTIHLLSGGEKALTAVALVFSIFELNPSPFCMLDEVDAPLDDANVGRFCEMVREMSERVQFIFITHNKITMDLANQLTGVTMVEPGVSRLVSVDIDEAVQLAAV
jgi:chromosome segregation protein